MDPYFRSHSTQKTLDHCFAPIFPAWPSTPEIRLLYQKTGSFRGVVGVGFQLRFGQLQLTFVFGTGDDLWRTFLGASCPGKIEVE
jgi:hypothetical protein